MKTETIPSSALPELGNRFWERLLQTLSPEFSRPDVEGSALAQAFNNSLSGCHIQEQLLWMGQFNEEIFARIKKELQPFGQMHFSEPTRFQLMYFDAIAKHSADVKRECMGPNATRRHAYLLKDSEYQCYDVESDIKRTNELLESKKREVFSAEIDFLDAISKDNLADAEVFFRAIMAKRRNADPLMRAEANNWHHLLALKKGDLAMFVDAWNGRVTEGAIVKERLADHLQKILYACVLTTFALTPSPEGRSKMQRQGREAFAQEHVGMYLKGAILDLADKLLSAGPMTAESFHKLVETIFEERRKLFVSVNHLVLDVRVIWK